MNPAGPTRALRAAAVAAGAAGALTLGVAGVLPFVAVVATAALTACTAVASAQMLTPVEATVRRRVAVTALACAALTALVVTGGDLSGSTGLALGLLLCTAAVTHSLVLDTVRDVRVNIAVSVSMLVLAAGLAPGLRIALPVVLTWVCVLIALALAARDAEGAQAVVRASTPDPAGAGARASRTALAGTVAATVLAGLAIAVVLPHPSGLAARTGFGSQGGADPGGSGSGAGRQAQAYLGSGTLSLDARGRLPDTPVAVVTGTDARLWRANALESYDGRGWSTRPTVATDLTPGGSTEAEIPPDGRSPQQAGTTLRTDGVGWLLAGTADATVLSPGLATTVRLRDRGQIVRDADGRIFTVGPSGTPSYVVDSAPVPRVDGAGPAESGVDATAPVWRALPPSVPARVAALARETTAGARSRTEAVRAVEAFLRSSFAYDLDSPVPPAGTDSVDHFLFESEAGFCEHFASAEVVMLRSLGIPARLVTGFSGGSPDGQGHLVLRASDAHAWVEAWVPGTGWVSSDPTAAAQPSAGRTDGVAAVLRAVRDALTGSPVRKGVLAAVLVALAALAVLAPGRRRRSAARATVRTPAAPLFAAFHRLESALAATGRPRAEAESIRALAARLHATEDVVGALLTVERAAYSAAPPDRAEAQRAADLIDRTAAQLLAVSREGASSAR